ncbi:MAG: acyl-ACP--UDP-N-acetylglucosamine O-acyltransferase [Planctomycetota bacterium]
MIEVRDCCGIHPMAYVHPNAEIASGVEIGPFSYIGEHVKISQGCKIHNNVTIIGHTTLGEHNEVFPHAVLGGEPQDLKFKGEVSYLILGDRNKIRENVTIHLGTESGGSITQIGSDNLLMACCHIAHDCQLGNHIVMANNVLLGGHVALEDQVVIGGAAALHHFVSVGEMAFIGGLTRVVQDVPPYMLIEGNPARIRSFNKVGLERNGLTPEEILSIKKAFRLLFHSELPQRQAMEKILEEETPTTQVKYLMNFLTKSTTGKLGRSNDTTKVKRKS